MSEYARMADRMRRHHYVDAYTRAMLDEAADAIEALAAERDALREALTRLTYLRAIEPDMTPEETADAWREHVRSMRAIARAALTAALDAPPARQSHAAAETQHRPQAPSPARD